MQKNRKSLRRYASESGRVKLCEAGTNINVNERLDDVKCDIIEKISKLFIDCGRSCEDVHAMLLIIELPSDVSYWVFTIGQTRLLCGCYLPRTGLRDLDATATSEGLRFASMNACDGQSINIL